MIYGPTCLLSLVKAAESVRGFREQVVPWIQDQEVVLWWIGSWSVLMFFTTLMVVPMLAIRIPQDYFLHCKRHEVFWSNQHRVVRWFGLIAKNVMGVVFILVGLAMLILPGQGILTIFIGLMLVNFPGKYAVERWCVARGPVLKSINWLRRRAGRSTLEAWRGRA